MTSEDLAIVARDPSLPGLSLVLDERKMEQVLQSLHPGLAFDSITKYYIRYKKGTNCLVKYQLSHQGVCHSLYAKAYIPDDSDKFKKRAPSTQSAPLRFVLEQESVLIAYFPHDEKLAVMSRLIEPLSREQLLERVLYQPQDFTGSSIETLQYKPERRFVGLLSTPTGQRAVIKIYTKGRYEQAKRARRQSVNGRRPLRLIGRSNKHHILVYQWLEGTPLSELWNQADFDPIQLMRTGKQLAFFHGKSAKKTLPERHNDEYCQQLNRVAKNTANLLPELQQQIESIAQRIGCGVRGLTSAKTRVHGDFYVKQVLVCPQEITLIDLDDVCRFYPSCDLGLFIAHLERDRIANRLNQTEVDTYRSALLEGYQAQKNYLEEEVALFTAAGLLQLIHHPFRNNEPNWPARTRAILQASLRHLEQFESNQQGNYRVVSDPDMPFLHQLLDVKAMSSTIQDALSLHHPELKTKRLRKITPLRHKVGKRILLEFIFSTDDGQQEYCVIGKARAKGFDRKTWRANCRLQELGFATDCADKIEIPKPLGYLASHHIWMQSKVNGQALFPHFCANDGTWVAERSADALYKLHASGVELEKMHTLQDELKILHRALASVAERHPDWQDRLDVLYAQCLLLADKLPPSMACPIHRDFYHDQLLVAGDKLYLLDLDLLCIGDPAIDVANFIAHIEEQCLREFGNMNHARQQVETFTTRYQDLSGQDITQQIAIYRVLTLARHLYISQRIPSRNSITYPLLEYCEAQVHELIRGSYSSKEMDIRHNPRSER